MQRNESNCFRFNETSMIAKIHYSHLGAGQIKEKVQTCEAVCNDFLTRQEKEPLMSHARFEIPQGQRLVRISSTMEMRLSLRL